MAKTASPPKNKEHKAEKQQARTVEPRLRDKILRRGPMKLPPQITGPESGLDLDELRIKLTYIANHTDGPDSNIRKKALAFLKSTLSEAKDRAQNMFEQGRLGGLETARLIASIHDDILTILYDFTVIHIVRASNPTKSERMSLCAVGGYGRGEMSPGSDLDLLFLHPEGKLSVWNESVTEYMLYMLWDMGLKVGQSSRTISQCITLAKDDQTILTALLDARFVTGDENLATELMTKFRRQVTKGSGRSYISTKLDERDERHKREGNSRYVIEPNIKEGKGGLRDLHVLYWIARFLDKDGVINDPQRAADYVALGLFDESAADRFVRAADFLWRTRCHLHYTAGRATDALTFDYQTKLARKMGYASGPVEIAVEKFMREYFTNAREVGALTRIACAKLEAEKAIVLPKGLDSLLPRSRRALKNPHFVIDHGRLNFTDRSDMNENPSLILKLFQLAGQHNYDIHPDALSAIDFRRNLIDNNFRKNSQNSEIFLSTLLEAKSPYATMKLMNESGVLGRYLIEFGGIVGRTQFNMHHAYTVDDHTLGLIRYFEALEQGKLVAENPIASQFAQKFTSSQRRILYMAILLHDTGKGVGDQCIEGARLSRRAAQRLGMSDDEVDTISWLIRRHLDMSETAQRRDISDPETVKTFAEKIGSIERLQLLMALTIVDIRAVGPGIWNDWKGALLRELYLVSADYLSDKPNIAPRSRALASQETVFERLPEAVRKNVQPLMSRLGDNYWLSFSITDQMRHARFFNGVVDSGIKHATYTRVNKEANITELWVFTHDRQGLFTDLAGAIYASGASISGARLHTCTNLENSDEPHKDVFDVFYLQDLEGAAFGQEAPSQLERLSQVSRKAAQGERVDIPARQHIASKRAQAIPVKASVKFEDRSAEDVVFLELRGRDRPGLLFELAKVLTDEGLIILSAHIEVVGAMVIDSFYLKYLPGTDEWRAAKRSRIKKRLMAVLTDAAHSQKNASTPA